MDATESSTAKISTSSYIAADSKTQAVEPIAAASSAGQTAAAASNAAGPQGTASTAATSANTGSVSNDYTKVSNSCDAKRCAFNNYIVKSDLNRKIAFLFQLAARQKKIMNFPSEARLKPQLKM